MAIGQEHLHCRCMNPDCPNDHAHNCKKCGRANLPVENKPLHFRKKPVNVEAMYFRTNSEADDANMNAIVIWINQGKSPDDRHAWHNGTDIFIDTLEGNMRAGCGDWIIKGVQGEFYPCKPDIFNETYEAV